MLVLISVMLRLQETMKLMGLSNWLHWAAWFTKYLLFFIALNGVIILIYGIHVCLK